VIPDPQSAPLARSRRFTPRRWAAPDLQLGAAGRGCLFRSRDRQARSGADFPCQFRDVAPEVALQTAHWRHMGENRGFALITIDVPKRFARGPACPTPYLPRSGHLLSGRQYRQAAHITDVGAFWVRVRSPAHRRTGSSLRVTFIFDNRHSWQKGRVDGFLGGDPWRFRPPRQATYCSRKFRFFHRWALRTSFVIALSGNSAPRPAPKRKAPRVPGPFVSFQT